MIESFLFGKSNSENETALRNTYKMYALGQVIDQLTGPFFKKVLSPQSKVEKEMQRLDLISKSLAANIDPNETLQKTGFAEKQKESVVVNNFSLLLPSKTSAELLPFTKKALSDSLLGLKSESGTLMTFPLFSKIAKKLNRV